MTLYRKYIFPIALILLLGSCSRDAAKTPAPAHPISSIKSPVIQPNTTPLTPQLAALFNSTPEKLTALSDSAATEALNGNYYYTVQGTVYATDFIKYLDKHARKKYGITLRSNCVTGFGSPIDYFYTCANSITTDTYGHDIYSQLYKEASEAYLKERTGITPFDPEK